MNEKRQHVFASLLLFKHWECSLGRNGKETDDPRKKCQEYPLLPDSWEDGASIPSLLPALRGNVSFNDTLSPLFPSLSPLFPSLSPFYFSLLPPLQLSSFFPFTCVSLPQFLCPNPAISRETCIKRKVTDREKRGTVIEKVKRQANRAAGLRQITIIFLSENKERKGRKLGRNEKMFAKEKERELMSAVISS